jgi:type I restriction enzyme S subunit
MFPSGTVLYAMYASIGECSIATVELCSSQAILGIRPHSSLDNHYLYFYLLSKRNEIKLIGQQGTQANLNAGMVKDFVLFLPTISEQLGIVEILNDMDAEIKALEQRREKINLLKQGMMGELLTGRIRLI